jgi:signal transduction histidine kinase
MTDAPLNSRPHTTAAIAVSLLAIAAISGIDLGRDLHRQSTARQVQFQKSQLALLSQLELGRAVQDFKDCLLRAASPYCDDFYGHMQAVDRDVSLYRAQSAERADEQQALTGLRQALVGYKSALDEVRDMQSRHATIQEIDRVVRGADRPAARELTVLASAAGTGPSGWTVPVGSGVALLISAVLAGVFLRLAFGSALPFGGRSRERLARPPELLARMITWEEDRRDKLASRLRDEVCQALSAIKYFLESVQAAAARGVAKELPTPVIPSLQSVIRLTREIAQQLEPAPIPNSGVLAAIQALWIEARATNPALAIDARTELREHDIPEGLAPIIFRIARMVAELGERQLTVSRIVWILQRESRGLRLTLELSNDDQPLIHASALKQLTAVCACVVLSGGSSKEPRDTGQSTAIVAAWPSSYPDSRIL